MPAYSLPLKVRCDQRFCTKRATETVFDHWNGKRGIYCAAHAKRWVKDWNDDLHKQIAKEELP